jgi:hypothetical protein
MQYAILIYEKPGALDGFSDDERRAITQEYVAVARDPRILGTGRLQPADTATTVRGHNGETLLTDGPFADTKEVFGGYYVLEADDIEAALELAAKLPATRLGGCVEVRPMVELPR